MKKIRTLFAFVALLLILLEPAALSAQKKRPLPTPPVETSGPDSASNPTSTSTYNPRSPEQAAMEMGMLLSRRSLVTDLERQRRRAAAQLAEDLERLEQINTTRIVPLSSAASLDYKDLAQASAEVRTRATRIKYYSPLGLVDRTGEKIRHEADTSQLATMLTQLSRAVERFVGNPVFRVSAPNDKELRSAAAHELENIIKLSDTINKIAKRLSKTLVARR